MIAPYAFQVSPSPIARLRIGLILPISAFCVMVLVRPSLVIISPIPSSSAVSPSIVWLIAILPLIIHCSPSAIVKGALVSSSIVHVAAGKSSVQSSAITETGEKERPAINKELQRSFVRRESMLKTLNFMMMIYLSPRLYKITIAPFPRQDRETMNHAEINSYRKNIVLSNSQLPKVAGTYSNIN